MLHSRMERVANLIKQELAQIIDYELENPNLPEFITISQVKVSNDLSQASVRVTFLEDEVPDRVNETIAELNRSAGFIRTLLARRVQLKRHPHLKFHYTDATRHAAEMERLFHQIRDEREEREGDRPEEHGEEA